MMRTGFYILLFVPVSQPQRQSNQDIQVPPNVGEQSGQIECPTLITDFGSVGNVHAGNRTNKDVEDCMWDINQINAGHAKWCHTGSFLPPAKVFGCIRTLTYANLRDCVMQSGMDMDELWRKACANLTSDDFEGWANDTTKPVADRDCANEFIALEVKCSEGCTGIDTATDDENKKAKAVMKRCAPKASENMQSYLKQCNSGSATDLSFLSLMVTIVFACCHCIMI